MLMFTVTSTKGGVGKTNLVIALALETVCGPRGARVVAFDADPQGSLLRWAKDVRHGHLMRGNPDAPPPIYLETPPDEGPMLLVKPFSGMESLRGLAVAENADLALVDCKISTEAADPQRGRNAMLSADLVLVPVVPAQIDLLSVDHCRDLLQTVPGLRVVHMLSRAQTNHVEAGRAILSHGGFTVLSTVIRERRDMAQFTEASTKGRVRRLKGAAGTDVRSLLRELEATCRGHKPAAAETSETGRAS